jgi:2-keto-4-pentenoate hydratase
MMPSNIITTCSDQLWQAECDRLPIETLSSRYADLGIEEAYTIAAQTLKRRSARRVGFKLGYTSAAMRQQMNIAAPNYGVLTTDHLITNADGNTDNLINMDQLIHPLVEPEIALLVGKEISGAGHSACSVLPAVSAVMPALEIVDTRYKTYTFTLADNISDNSSAARVVLGAPKMLSEAGDLRTCGVLLWSKGRCLDSGVGANAMGDPLVALAWLANFLAAKGELIPAGSVVITGGLTKAQPAQAGQSFVAEFAGLGGVKAYFGDHHEN